MAQFGISAALYDLGLKMKQYVQFYIIALVSTIIGSIIFMFILFSSFDMSDSSGMYVFSGSLVFFIIFIIAIGIWGLIRFFRFLKAIKNAADETGDPNLDKGYRYQIYAIIVNILTVVGVAIFIAVLFGSSFTDTDFFFDYFMPSFYTFILVIVIAAIAPVILNIMAYIALYDWAQQLSFHLQNYYGHEIEQGFSYMKWGTIIQVVFGWAFILVLIGMHKAAGALMNQYNPQGFVTPPGYGQYTQGGYGASYPYVAPPGYQPGYTYQPNTPSYSPQPQGNLTQSDLGTQAPKPSDFCANCGSKLPMGSVKFCPQCGFRLN